MTQVEPYPQLVKVWAKVDSYKVKEPLLVNTRKSQELTAQWLLYSHNNLQQRKDRRSWSNKAKKHLRDNLALNASPNKLNKHSANQSQPSKLRRLSRTWKWKVTNISASQTESSKTASSTKEVSQLWAQPSLINNCPRSGKLSYSQYLLTIWSSPLQLKMVPRLRGETPNC